MTNRQNNYLKNKNLFNLFVIFKYYLHNIYLKLITLTMVLGGEIGILFFCFI